MKLFSQNSEQVILFENQLQGIYTDYAIQEIITSSVTSLSPLKIVAP
jgi:hypothetical protein